MTDTPTQAELLEALEESILGLKYHHNAVSRFNDGLIPNNLRSTIDTLESHKHAMAAGVELEKRLGRLLILFQLDDESSSQKIDRIALVVQKETGVLPPGKDTYTHSPSEQQDAMDAWVDGLIKDARAALAAAQPLAKSEKS